MLTHMARMLTRMTRWLAYYTHTSFTETLLFCMLFIP